MITTKTNVRPKTAFKPESDRVKKEALRDAFITGKLESHLKKEENSPTMEPVNQAITAPISEIRSFSTYSVGDKLTSAAPRPKKKTFEQILREAEEKVQLDAQE